MATVFLSYGRDDGIKAGSVAAALEKAGHSVWWDQNIQAGRQYSKEIEEALKAADAVVVLWSKDSIESAWVRDEAAAGRDSDRLIPVRLDGCDPPLGFRQFQTIDLSRWNGHRGTEKLKNLVDAVARSAKSRPAAPPPAVIAAPPVSRDQWRPLVAVIAVCLLVAGIAFWRLSQGSPSVPLVAVTSVDQSPGPKAWSRDLLVKLASLQIVNTNDFRLVDQASETPPDLIFEVGGSVRPENPEASLVLRSGRDRSLLWSKDFQQPGSKLADVKQQLAHVAAQVLRCAVEGMDVDGKPLGQEVLRRYLSGCSAIATIDDPGPLLGVFLDITRQAPRFGGAWAKVLKIEARRSALQSTSEREKARQSIEHHISSARKIYPHMAESYLAEAELLPTKSFFERITLLDRAVEYNPQNSESLVQRSGGLLTVGRLNDALNDAQRAAEMDPLSPATRDQYIMALIVSGLTTSALKELEKADRLWPGATNLANTLFFFHLHYGDPREALRTLDLQRFQVGPTWATYEPYLKARIDPSESNVEQALAKARSVATGHPNALTMLMQGLATWGREKELFDTLLQSPPGAAGVITHVIFRPAFRGFWRNPRSMQVAAHVGLLDYWRKSGKWPDFCFEPTVRYDCKSEGRTGAQTPS